MNPLPTGAHIPKGELPAGKADETTPTQCKFHTQPRSKHPAASCPPSHSEPPRNATQTTAHRRNRAYTTSTVPTAELPTKHQDGTNSPGKRSPVSARRNGQARASHNTTPAHRRNRADPTKHCTHNRTPDPAAWPDKLTHPTLRPASRMCSFKERAPAMRWDLPASFGGPNARQCTKGPQARAGRPGMHQPKTPATYPPGPRSPKVQQGPQPGGRCAPGTPSPQAHPRPTQEQHGHQASDLCPSAQAPREHRMQPPDVSPESHQSPSLTGPQSPAPNPPAIPAQGHHKCPSPDTPPNPPRRPTGGSPPPLGDGAN
ncbi:proteoglycan 4-like [Girardinichthys multiradiatus]|uniref:proteoglycan 4-like n=1 Tax=Girardinichthys multiradiatus TaxID=208333 RepID=UPI001FAC401A|nr:proteoglycan 4-like [Girardinichthys multiradiatus]